MKFPNAAKGVKKIYTAEILALLSSIFLVIAACLFVFGYAAGEAGTANGSDVGLAMAGGSMILALVFVLAWSVLALIAFILNIVGIVNASHDETNFKSALLFLIVGIVSAILAGVFANSNGTVSSLLYSLYNLMNVFVTIFVIAGGVKLADRLNRGDVGRKGSNVLKLIIIINVLSLIASLISTFMGGMVASVAAGVLLIVALVLNIVQYFMYLSFLSKAKKMLIENK
ncbi:MAG: hypothetical protein IJH07_02370 [Ruminococcus sp.]|nr:hypothetical protein [Ruminococcus sp.]